MKKALKDLSLDPRYYQIGFQGIFLAFGIAILGWQTEWQRVGVYLVVCLVTQLLVNIYTKQSLHSLKSAFITALGLGLLLNTCNLWIAALAAVIAITSKSLIRFNGKHIFNPGNLGIMAVVLLTNQAWISPGQWGSHSLFPIGIIGAGLIILSKVKRVETGFVFYGVLIGLELIRQHFYLGWPLDFWWHRVSNGSILVYALFMITDPKTTPSHRTARMTWAAILALFTFMLGCGMQLYAAPIYALLFISPFTPLFDRIWKAKKYNWTVGDTINAAKEKIKTKHIMRKEMIKPLLLLLAMLVVGSQMSAFCGFYVAKASASIFNKKSQVILVHDGDRTTITMQNNFKGSLKEFAMVIPVPVVLKKDDITIKENSLFANLDAYSAPRLVEYHDRNPCYQPVYRGNRIMAENASVQMLKGKNLDYVKKVERKVKIEAKYSIDEYDIIILSAKESWALEAWLRMNGYSLPENAKEVLTPYIKDKMKFFAVKINLEKAKNLPKGTLRPIQIKFKSDKFMLPIRLGMANANGEDQDLIIYAFTRTGRVETANYRTVEMPTARKIPTFIKQDYGNFYKEMFDRKYRNEGRNAVFLEYAWNVSPTWGVKCDPCVGTPPVVKDLSDAGVHWVDPDANYSFGRTAVNVFFTRMHVRYSRDRFPSDLTFIETPNKKHYQVRQIITNPARGTFDCDQGLAYLKKLKNRRIVELHEMEALTGRNSEEYPYYVELGSGKKKPIAKQQNNPIQENVLPVGIGNNGQPPFWLLPFSIISIILLMQLIKWASRKHLKI